MVIVNIVNDAVHETSGGLEAEHQRTAQAAADSDSHTIQHGHAKLR